MYTVLYCVHTRELTVIMLERPAHFIQPRFPACQTTTTITPLCYSLLCKQRHPGFHNPRETKRHACTPVLGAVLCKCLRPQHPLDSTTHHQFPFSCLFTTLPPEWHVSPALSLVYAHEVNLKKKNHQARVSNKNQESGSFWLGTTGNRRIDFTLLYV